MLEPNVLEIYERQFGPFTHMAQSDKSIWLRYLMQGGTKYAPFIYDLRVGDGLDMGATATGMEKRAAFALTTKRIDALCEIDQVPVIIEVKQRAGLSAVGQLIGYRDLFAKSFPDKPKARMLLVTDTLQPDMISVLISSDIQYVEVGQ